MGDRSQPGGGRAYLRPSRSEPPLDGQRGADHRPVSQRRELRRSLLGQPPPVLGRGALGFELGFEIVPAGLAGQQRRCHRASMPSARGGQSEELDVAELELEVRQPRRGAVAPAATGRHIRIGPWRGSRTKPVRDAMSTPSRIT